MDRVRRGVPGFGAGRAIAALRLIRRRVRRQALPYYA
jgi:hypothetical protein